MPQPPKVVSLDEIEHLPGPGTITWLPVRHTLDIRAFGCNAYVAGAAGEDAVEPHTEGDDPAADDQELYFVARGHATFTIDGETHEAPAGSYVFIPDPRSHRHAIAREPGTTVLSFGAPPNFQPAAWEWVFRAEPLYASDPERARAILNEGLAELPGNDRLRGELARLGG